MFIEFKSVPGTVLRLQWVSLLNYLDNPTRELLWLSGLWVGLGGGVGCSLALNRVSLTPGPQPEPHYVAS